MARIFVILFLALSFETSYAASYYELLVEQFSLAKEPISALDFDEVDSPNAKTCLETTESKPYETTPVNIFRYTRVVDGNGPALPPVEITKVIYNIYGSDTFQYDFDFVTTSVKGTELTSRHKYSSSKNWALYARKNNGLVYFRRAGKMGDTVVDNYGYCY